MPLSLQAPCVKSPICNEQTGSQGATAGTTTTELVKEKQSEINFDYLSEMSNGDESFIIEMIKIFLNEIPTAI